MAGWGIGIYAGFYGAPEQAIPDYQSNFCGIA